VCHSQPTDLANYFEIGLLTVAFDEGMYRVAHFAPLGKFKLLAERRCRLLWETLLAHITT